MSRTIKLVCSVSTVYLVNLLRLTFNTPKKSSLLSPPLCRSNVRVCFHTMRSVSTVRNTFLKSSLSILYRLLHFPVPRIPPLQSGAAFSSPAFSTPAFLLRVRILICAARQKQCRQRVYRIWYAVVSRCEPFHVTLNKYQWSSLQFVCEFTICVWHSMRETLTATSPATLHCSALEVCTPVLYRM